MFKLLGCVGLCLGILLKTAPAAHAAVTAKTLTFTTFNIRWYGLNGDAMGETGSEARDKTIREHLIDNQLLTDVIAFEEIVDVDGLKRLIGDDYSCESYDHVQPRHQHVVVCVKSPLQFVTAEDDNFTFEDIALEHHRPAVHGCVTTSQGRKLVHFVAVHLKAMPHKTNTRLTQAELLSSALADMSTKLPTIITGDFNTFKDENERIELKFAERGLDLVEEHSDLPFTFRTDRYQNKFDRVYSSGVKYSRKPKVIGPCNDDATREERSRYYQEISDHCAVTWGIRVD